MTQFKPGDRVKYTGTTTMAARGTTATVVTVSGESDDNAWVTVRDLNPPVFGDTTRGFAASNLRRLAEPAPADILRAQADVFTADAAEADRQRAELARRVIELDEKSMASRRLAAQYRAVATDLEARG